MKVESLNEDAIKEICNEHNEKKMLFCKSHKKYLCTFCIDDHQSNNGCVVISNKAMIAEAQEYLSKQMQENMSIGNKLKDLAKNYQELISKKKEEENAIQVETRLQLLKPIVESEKSRQGEREQNELKNLKDRNTLQLKEIAKTIDLLKDYKSSLEAINDEFRTNFDNKKYFQIFNAYNGQNVAARPLEDNEKFALLSVNISKSLKNENLHKEINQIQKYSEIMIDEQMNDKMSEFINQLELEETYKSEGIQCFPQSLYHINNYSNKICMYNINNMQYYFEEVFSFQEVNEIKYPLEEKETSSLPNIQNNIQKQTNFGFDSIMTDGCIYFFGGLWGKSNYDTDCFVYCCSTKKSQKVSPLNHSRCDHTLMNFKSTIFCVGGRWQNQFLDSVEQYDIISNKLAILDSRLSEPKSLVTLISHELQNKIFCIGGYLEIGISSKIEYMILNNKGHSMSPWIILNIKMNNANFKLIMIASAFLLKSSRTNDHKEEKILLFGGIFSTELNLI